jgi:hypothetical protein
VSDLLTITETKRRLRAAAKAARTADRNVPSNARVEVGYRAIPVYADTAYDAGMRAFASYDDDLDEFGSIDDAARNDQVRREGYVAHLYFSTTGTWGELVSVVTVWTGTDERDAFVIHF